VDGTGSGSCPVAGFGIIGVEPWVLFHTVSKDGKLRELKIQVV